MRVVLSLALRVVRRIVEKSMEYASPLKKIAINAKTVTMLVKVIAIPYANQSWEAE